MLFAKEQLIFILFLVISFGIGVLFKEEYTTIVSIEKNKQLKEQINKPRLRYKAKASTSKKKRYYSFVDKDIKRDAWLEVEIRGFVRRPGIYKLQKGTSFNGLLKLAGGSTLLEMRVKYQNDVLKDGDSFYIK